MNQSSLSRFSTIVSQVLFAAMLLLVAGCNQGTPTLNTSNWIRFSPDGGYFSVLLPSEPVKQEPKTNTEFEATTYRIVTALSNVAGMAVGYADRPANHQFHSEPAKILDAMRDQAVADLSGQLIEEKTIQLGAYPGREVLISVPAGFSVRQRIYLANQRVYSLMVIAGSKGLASPEAETFFNSFQIAAK